MDDYDLGTRLSYFLTGGPPDTALVQLAGQQQLATNLQREAERLLPFRATDSFIKDFTEQWLDTALLSNIMPDPKLRFPQSHINTARSEVEHFFAAMLRENRPMSDFID